MTKQEKRAEARAKGFCGECCCRKAVPGRMHCQQCLDRHKRYDTRRIRVERNGKRFTIGMRDTFDSWCIDCQLANGHRVDCSSSGATVSSKGTGHVSLRERPPANNVESRENPYGGERGAPLSSSRAA